MLTPKVEVRLRSAAKAHIPLKLSCTISTHSDPLQAVITFPGTYPADNLLIEVGNVDRAIRTHLDVDRPELTVLRDHQRRERMIRCLVS